MTKDKSTEDKSKDPKRLLRHGRRHAHTTSLWASAEDFGC